MNNIFATLRKVIKKEAEEFTQTCVNTIKQTIDDNGFSERFDVTQKTVKENDSILRTDILIVIKNLKTKNKYPATIKVYLKDNLNFSYQSSNTEDVEYSKRERALFLIIRANIEDLITAFNEG